MIKYFIIILFVTVFDCIKLVKKRDMKKLHVLYFFIVLTLIASYIYVEDPFNASYSELFLKLVNSDYLTGD